MERLSMMLNKLVEDLANRNTTKSKLVRNKILNYPKKINQLFKNQQNWKETKPLQMQQSKPSKYKSNCLNGSNPELNWISICPDNLQRLGSTSFKSHTWLQLQAQHCKEIKRTSCLSFYLLAVSKLSSSRTIKMSLKFCQQRNWLKNQIKILFRWWKSSH